MDRRTNKQLVFINNNATTFSIGQSRFLSLTTFVCVLEIALSSDVESDKATIFRFDLLNSLFYSLFLSLDFCFVRCNKSPTWKTFLMSFWQVSSVCFSINFSRNGWDNVKWLLGGRSKCFHLINSLITLEMSFCS